MRTELPNGVGGKKAAGASSSAPPAGGAEPKRKQKKLIIPAAAAALVLLVAAVIIASNGKTAQLRPIKAYCTTVLDDKQGASSSAFPDVLRKAKPELTDPGVYGIETDRDAGKIKKWSAALMKSQPLTVKEQSELRERMAGFYAISDIKPQSARYAYAKITIVGETGTAYGAMFCVVYKLNGRWYMEPQDHLNHYGLDNMSDFISAQNAASSGEQSSKPSSSFLKVPSSPPTTSSSSKVPSSANTATVTYNANGGYGEPESQTVEVKNGVASFYLSTKKPTRNGYTFIGWRLENSTAYAVDAPGQHISIQTSAYSRLTYYAQWN